MATGGLYGNSTTGAAIASPTAESNGLYGNSPSFGGTYFEWFIFQVSDLQPATPTGGSWSFQTNTGTPPTGWLSTPPSNPTNTVWVSIALVNSKNGNSLTWSTPGMFSFASGLPILSGASAPTSGDGQSNQMYIETGTSPQSIWFKESGTWTKLTGSTLYVDLTSDQTIAGTKTFASQIQGSISGNASNVTGVVGVDHGGTGSTTASAARTALGAAASGANSDITSLSGITGGISTPDYITFDTAPSTTPTTPGTLYWDSADGNQTLSLVMAGGTSTQQIGEEQYYRIKASSAISNGQVVMFTGTVGASGALTGAPATGLTAATASYVMGIATQDIALNGWGYVTSFGLIRQLNTSAFTAGDILYLDPTVAGGLTTTIPTAPNPKVQVCACIYSSASNGSLFVRPSFGGALGQYEGDVNIASPAAYNLLQRNATNTRWENVAASSVTVGNVSGTVAIDNGGTGATTASSAATNLGLGTGNSPSFTGLTISGGTANGVAYLNGSKVLTTGSALTFDGTNFATTGVVKTGTTGSLGKVQLARYTDGAYVSELRLAGNGAAPNYELYHGVAGDMLFYTAGSEQMRLTSTGLGIGTSSPATKLHIANNLTAYNSSPTVQLTGSVKYNSAGALISVAQIGFAKENATDGNGQGYINFLTRDSGGSVSERARIDSSGNLGLGVTPSAWDSNSRVIEGYAAAGFAIAARGTVPLFTSSNAYRNASSQWTYQSNGYAYLTGIAGNGNSTGYAWWIAPSGTAGNAITFTQAMTLDSSGNLLVGTTSSSLTNSNSHIIVPNGSIYTQHVSGTGSGATYYGFVYNAGVIGSITQNGTTGVLYNLTSDYRLKNDPQPLTGAKEFVMALQPKKWQWWDGSGEGVGFIAHEFMEVAKYSGMGEKDAVDENGKPVYQSIQPSSSEVMANLVALIQEQQNLIQQLQAQLTSVSADVAALKGQA